VLQKNKLPLILSSAVILLPCLVGISLRILCPETFASEWSETTTGRFWNIKTALLVFSTLFILAVHWLCFYFITKDPKTRTQSDKVLSLGLWIVPMFSLISGCTLIEAATGKDFGIGFVMQLFLCTLFFILGNYMPKCKPNHSIGIKLPWTLHSEENWAKTHRVTGMFWVAGSVTMFLFMMVFENGFIAKIIPVLLIMTVGPILFSVLYYRKQVKDGVVSKLEKGMSSPTNRSFAFSSVFSIISVILVALLLISGTIEYHFGEDSFTVKANYWEDVTVVYSEIDSVEYREIDTPGRRVMGFGSFSLLMGTFENSEFGAYTRYSYSDCMSCVVLRADEKVLVLNKKDEASTKELYETLLSKTK